MKTKKNTKKSGVRKKERKIIGNGATYHYVDQAAKAPRIPDNVSEIGSIGEGGKLLQIFDPTYWSSDLDKKVKFAVAANGLLKPFAKDGETIVCVANPTYLRNGSLCLFQLDDRLSIRCLVRKGDTVSCRPVNNSYVPVTVPLKDIEIIGVVVGKWSQNWMELYKDPKYERFYTPKERRKLQEKIRKAA